LEVAIETPATEALAGVVASTALLGAGAAVARRTSVLARLAKGLANSNSNC